MKNKSKLSGWLTKKGEQYKEHKAKAPERRAARLKKMQQQTEMVKAKTSLMTQRAKLTAARQRAMPPSMFGPPQIPGLPTFDTGSTVQTKKRRKKKKSKGRKVVTTYY